MAVIKYYGIEFCDVNFWDLALKLEKILQSYFIHHLITKKKYGKGKSMRTFSSVLKQ